MLIRYENLKGHLEEEIIEAGTSFHFEPGAIHQEEAITDVKIVEASTPYFNDRVRVEKKYNLIEKGGLQTTKKKDVYLK